MKNLLLEVVKVASFGLAAKALVLTFQTSAQAYDFTFSGFSAGSHSASGTFRINNATPEGNISAADFEDWEIELINGDGGANLTLYGPGGGFGTHNSDFWDLPHLMNTATFNSTSLSFTSSWAISNPEGGSGSGNYIIQNNDSRIFVNGSFDRSNTTDAFLSASATTVPTPVPFEVSTDLSILILGGLYGASRLRKTIAAHK